MADAKEEFRENVNTVPSEGGETMWIEIVVCVVTPAATEGAAIIAPMSPMTAPIRAPRMASSL